MERTNERKNAQRILLARHKNFITWKIVRSLQSRGMFPSCTGFLRGFSGILDMGATLSILRISKTLSSDWASATADDWYGVGNDMRKALDTYKQIQHSQRQESSYHGEKQEPSSEPKQLDLTI